MSAPWVILLVLLQLANAAEFDCDCHDGDVAITAPFQILQSPPDTCSQTCVWRISANSDDQRVQLTVQEADPALTITILDGADEVASPILPNCDTSAQESVCYSKSRYMIIKSAINPSHKAIGNNFALRFASVSQSSAGGNNGSTASHDHTGLIIGLVVAFVILLILIIIVIFLVYAHFKKRRERQYASSIEANGDMIYAAPPTPSIAPTAPPRTSVVPRSLSFEYEGSIEPSNPPTYEYFMSK